MVGTVFLVFLIIPLFVLIIFRIRELIAKRHNNVMSRIDKAKMVLLLMMEVGLVLLAGYVTIVYIIMPPCAD